MVVQFSEEISYSDTKDDNGDNVQWHSFLSLESPHPYGVLPAGNKFLLSKEYDNNDKAPTGSSKEDTKTKNCLVDTLRDDTWLSILGFLDGNALGNAVQTCRFFYVCGHQPELWRDLVLRKLEREKTVLDKAGNSWKDTYVILSTRTASSTCNTTGSTSAAAASASAFVESKPMKIPGIYSDDLYRLHSCRAFAIPPAWLRQPTPTATTTSSNNTQQSKKLHRNAVPRVEARDMTCHKFVTNYENPNQPVVITGGAKTWKAFRDWKDPAYLRQHTAGRTFRATSGMAPLPVDVTLEAFQDYCTNPNLEEAPLYLFDREALKIDNPLHQDFYADMQQSCPYFDPARTMNNTSSGGSGGSGGSSSAVEGDDNKDGDDDIVGHDLFQVLGEGKRPDHTWAIIGGNHSGSVFHIDPNCTHAWNAAICGRKRWIFYPPGVTPPGIHPSDDGDSFALPLSVGEWILSFWREHQHRKATAPPARRPLECTAFAGDVVFIPHGWWHMVINLDKINVAVTHNYVSRSQLGNVLRFLDSKENQISGCRDRTESIKPDKLHSTFTSALQENFGKDAEWLVNAQQQAASHWTCKAWKDSDAAVDDQNGKEEGANLCRLPKKRRVGTQEEDNEPGSSVMLKAKAADTSDSGSAPFSFSFL